MISIVTVVSIVTQLAMLSSLLPQSLCPVKNSNQAKVGS